MIIVKLNINHDAERPKAGTQVLNLSDGRKEKMNSFTMIIVYALNMMLYSVIFPALVPSVAMVAFICLLALIVRIGNTDQNTAVGRSKSLFQFLHHTGNSTD